MLYKLYVIENDLGTNYGAFWDADQKKWFVPDQPYNVFTAWFYRKPILIILISFFFLNNVFGQNNPNESGNQQALTDYIDIYQKYISSISGSNCQMYPSCSNFGMGAYKTYNPFKATFLTADRLLRCSHDHKNYNKILTNNGVRIADFPVPNTVEENQLLRSKNKAVLFSALDTSVNGKFINYLISKKYYREALLELNRQIFYNPEKTPESQYLNYLICKRALNEMEDAIFSYENTFPASIRNTSSITHEIGNIHFELGNYEKALTFYEACIHSFSDSILHDKSVLMKGLVLATQKKWNDSKRTFLLLPEKSIYNYSKENCLAILNNREAVKYKSPFLAGTLSIIPGLGYVYTGHKQTALSSLIINGLLAYATYSSYKNENYGMSALVGLFSFSFYVGNISGAAKSAKRYNYKQDYNTITNIKSNIYY